MRRSYLYRWCKDTDAQIIYLSIKWELGGSALCTLRLKDTSLPSFFFPCTQRRIFWHGNSTAIHASPRVLLLQVNCCARFENELTGTGFEGSLLHLLRLGSISSLRVVQVRPPELYTRATGKQKWPSVLCSCLFCIVNCWFS